MRRLIPLLLLLAGCASPDPVIQRIRTAHQGDGPLVVTAVFGLVPFQDAPLPVYLHIENTADQPDTLRSATGAGGLPNPMIHGAAMAEAHDLVVPAHGELRLEPGGAHLMFEPPLPPLQRGDSIGLTLHFARAGALAVQAWIVEYAEADLVR